MVRGCFGWIAKPNTRLSDHSPVRTCRQLSPPSGLTQAPVPMVPAQIVKLSAIAASSLNSVYLGIRLSGFRFPAGVRNVDHHTVGAGPFHLKFAVASASYFHIEPLFFLEALPLGALQLRGGLIEVLDLEAEMMDAAVVRPIGADIGTFLRLPVQDRQVDVAVGQKHGAVRGTPDLLHPESVPVEGGDLCGLLCRQRDVFDSRHGFLLASSKPECACSGFRARPRPGRPSWWRPYLRLERIRRMLIVDGQISLLEKGTAPPATAAGASPSRASDRRGGSSRCGPGADPPGAVGSRLERIGHRSGAEIPRPLRHHGVVLPRRPE